MVREERFAFKNAPIPIVLSVLGNTTEVNPVASLNAKVLSVVTPSGITAVPTQLTPLSCRTAPFSTLNPPPPEHETTFVTVNVNVCVAEPSEFVAVIV